MDKQIDTLVQDIYGLFGNKDYIPVENVLEEFSSKLAAKIRYRVLEEKKPDVLRISNLGTNCHRQLWYRINTPQVLEKLGPETRMKFLLGDILEELLLFLAKEAGHSVVGEQDDLDLYGVPGHRDAIIDGILVDVKSASSYSFKKFEAGLRKEDDAFGYLSQLGGYLEASQQDEKVLDKSTAAFLVIDKTLGKICLDIHKFSFTKTEQRIEDTRRMLSRPEPPHRYYESEPDGKSGNKVLGINCSYCSVKKACYPALRAFSYYNGPRYFSKIVREPNVPEIKL